MLKKVLAVILSAAFILGAAGCSSSSEETSSSSETTEAEEKDTLRIAYTADPEGLDPQKTSAVSTLEITSNIFDTLITCDSDWNIIPDLANDWTVSEDGMSIIFYLNEGVLFHNGREMTAQDVKYSFERLVLDDSPKASMYENINSIVIDDDYTITFSTETLDVDFLLSFAYPWVAIIPEECSDDLKTNPVGTGAYKFVDWTPQQSVTLVRNDDYFGTKANIENVEFVLIADYTSQLAALMVGDIDITEVTADQIDVLNSTDGLKGEIMDHNSIQILALNQENEYLSNEKVRQAIAMAIDKDEIIDTVMWGNGTKIGSHLPSTSPYYVDTTDVMPYDVEAAKELLAEAGYPDGFTLSLKLPKPYQPHCDTGQIIADQLSKIGITCDIEIIEWATWMSDVYTDKNYDMTVVAHSGRLDPYNFLSRYKSTSGDYISLLSGDVDDLLDAALQETDEDARKEIYAEIQYILAEEVPCVYIQTICKFYGLNESVQGFKRFPIDILDLKSVSFS
ncbi:MAG: ABC transporter substrate-binding protein [Clostridiales bacterium]|nr:ABC transporter substrate-binding protein [Clostridiales bacterium]